MLLTQRLESHGLGNDAAFTRQDTRMHRFRIKCRERVMPSCSVQPIKLKVRNEGWGVNLVKLVSDKSYISI